MDPQPKTEQRTASDTMMLHAPLAFKTTLAKRVQKSFEMHALDLEDYVWALETSGEQAASQQLWDDLIAVESPTEELWRHLRCGESDSAEVGKHVLMILVAIDGWARIKRCARTSCRRVFADASNGSNRRHCCRHVSH